LTLNRFDQKRMLNKVGHECKARVQLELDGKNQSNRWRRGKIERPLILKEIEWTFGGGGVGRGGGG
jgi:hypothetical protein